MARFRLRFNQYRPNIKLNGEGRRGFKQEKLIEHFSLCSHNGIHEDTKIQVTGHCDSKNQEAGEDIWIFHLDTFHFPSASARFKSKMRIKILNKLIQFFNERFVKQVS